MRILLVLLIASSLAALPAFNPASPRIVKRGIFCSADCWNVRASYLGNFVFDRKLKDQHASISDFAYDSNSLQLTLNAYNLFDLYVYAGESWYSYDNTQKDTPGTSRHVWLHSRTRTLYGAGMTCILYRKSFQKKGALYIGLDAKYQGMLRNPLDRATIDDRVALTNGTNYRSWETQVSCGPAYRVGFFVPYATLLWAYTHVTENHGAFISDSSATVSLYHLKPRNHFGWALGCSLVDDQRMDVTAEVRFVTEHACSVQATLRF